MNGLDSSLAKESSEDLATSVYWPGKHSSAAAKVAGYRNMQCLQAQLSEMLLKNLMSYFMTQ